MCFKVDEGNHRKKEDPHAPKKVAEFVKLRTDQSWDNGKRRKQNHNTDKPNGTPGSV